MSKVPRIIVTSSLLHGQQYESHADILRYVAMLQRLGAEAVVVPKGAETADALRNFDIRGVLFSGGGDIDAARYLGHSQFCTRVDRERDDGEIELFQQAYFNNVPILAICRGMQIANVALGGSLVEDIPAQWSSETPVMHHCGVNGAKRFKHMHEVRIVEDSELEKIVRSSIINVNSVHHQAMRELVPQFVPSAYSRDGIVEAIEPEGTHPGFFLGVQWHPEALPPDDNPSRAIFESFVRVCRGT